MKAIAFVTVLVLFFCFLFLEAWLLGIALAPFGIAFTRGQSIAFVLVFSFLLGGSGLNRAIKDALE